MRYAAVSCDATETEYLPEKVPTSLPVHISCTLKLDPDRPGTLAKSKLIVDMDDPVLRSATWKPLDDAPA